ncbi:MAG: trypsin-like serine protease, partial [Elusimicrobiota bacterium]
MSRMLAPLFAVFVVFVLPSAPASAQAEGKVIYGSDDRLDVYQVKDPRLKKLADSTAALFRSDHVTLRDGKAQLWTIPYGSSLAVCRDEPFYSQESGAFCSGALVAPDVIMTAGHCVKS